MRVSAAMLFVPLALTASAAAAQTLVMRVDQATAIITGSNLIVSAKGAVRSGGWEHPRLILRQSKHALGDIEMDFIATPPQDAAVVAQSIVPVNVSLKTRLPKSGIAAVRINAQSNSVTAQIIPKSDRQHTARR